MREIQTEQSIVVREPRPKEEGGSLVESVVRRLNALCKQATLEFAIDVGKLIIDSFYRGDLGSFRNRDPRKDVSLRKLARHPDLPMSAGALYRSVAIFELCERVDIRHCSHLSSSHLRLVLPLPCEDQVRLLRSCEKEKWTVRKLDQQVAALRVTGERSLGGGQRRSRVLVSVRRAARALQELAACLETSQHGAGSPDVLREIAESLQRARSLCDLIEASAG